MKVKFQIHMFILPAISFKFLGPGLSLKSSSFSNAVKLDVFCQLAIFIIKKKKRFSTGSDVLNRYLQLVHSKKYTDILSLI